MLQQERFDIFSSEAVLRMNFVGRYVLLLHSACLVKTTATIFHFIVIIIDVTNTEHNDLYGLSRFII